jgi:nicotinic acetylcholine receptor
MLQTPDIVLFNNADGNYEASFKSNIVIYADAEAPNPNILWVPPAIYKSSCTIDVTYFPFDGNIDFKRSCLLKYY